MTEERLKGGIGEVKGRDQRGALDSHMQTQIYLQEALLGALGYFQWKKNPTPNPHFHMKKKYQVAVHLKPHN